MISKESIINVIENNGTIKIPWKREISEWYSELSIYEYNNFFYVDPLRMKFVNSEDAANYFLYEGFTSRNAGYVLDICLMIN